jgi:hypothetical protein
MTEVETMLVEQLKTLTEQQQKQIMLLAQQQQQQASVIAQLSKRLDVLTDLCSA